ASGPVVTRSTKSSSGGRLLSASAASSRQTDSASDDIPDAERSSSFLDTDSAASSPTNRRRLSTVYGANRRPVRTDVASVRSSDGANDRSRSFTCHNLREELSPNVLHSWNDECAIEKIVLLLTTGLRDEKASVTRGAMKESSLMPTRWVVLGAHRVV